MLKIFIGTSEHQDTAAERVLVYSLHRNTNYNLDITFSTQSSPRTGRHRMTTGRSLASAPSQHAQR